jgi:hypothetical protein
MPRTMLLLMAVILLTVGMVGCQKHEATWDAMIAFDQAYIPALALTSQQQGAEARAIMPEVLVRWQTLQQRVPAAWARQDAWRQTVTDVTTRLTKADALIRDGHLTEAHEALEVVRTVLMTQRIQHGIDYFIDRLTAYHEPMEAIVLTAKGKTPATLTDADIAALRRHLQEAQALWQPVESARIDPKLYRFSDKAFTALGTGIRQESAALQALQTALAAEDRQRIIKAAIAIKPPFAELFMLFGDFTLAQ